MMINKELYPLLILFFMGMAGVILKRNILTSILCLTIMTITTALMFLVLQGEMKTTEQFHLPLILILYSVIQLAMGIMFSVKFYKSKKTLMTEDMKIRVQ
ncbi:MAG: NADH-quinone oxidoreductase subunit K [Bacteriovoracaceae bacterium]|nr:NADH-quinone oxidoreductase subunit K [Bacteriovoracaceae bacterium]